jgi:uncharacterized membrane protein
LHTAALTVLALAILLGVTGQVLASLTCLPAIVILLAFRLAEAVIDNHILHLHHVVETDGHLVRDLGFLASGVLLVGVGWAVIRAGAADTLPQGASGHLAPRPVGP